MMDLLWFEEHFHQIILDIHIIPWSDLKNQHHQKSHQQMHFNSKLFKLCIYSNILTCFIEGSQPQMGCELLSDPLESDTCSLELDKQTFDGEKIDDLSDKSGFSNIPCQEHDLERALDSKLTSSYDSFDNSSFSMELSSHKQPIDSNTCSVSTNSCRASRKMIDVLIFYDLNTDIWSMICPFLKQSEAQTLLKVFSTNPLIFSKLLLANVRQPPTLVQWFAGNGPKISAKERIDLMSQIISLCCPAPTSGECHIAKNFLISFMLQRTGEITSNITELLKKYFYKSNEKFLHELKSFNEIESYSDLSLDEYKTTLRILVNTRQWDFISSLPPRTTSFMYETDTLESHTFGMATLCAFEENNIPLMINCQMEKLSLSLEEFGEYLSNQTDDGPIGFGRGRHEGFDFDALFTSLKNSEISNIFHSSPELSMQISKKLIKLIIDSTVGENYEISATTIYWIRLVNELSLDQVSVFTLYFFYLLGKLIGQRISGFL